MTLNERSEVKSNIASGFIDHDFLLYDGNTYWVSTGNNKADIAALLFAIYDLLFDVNTNQTSNSHI